MPIPFLASVILDEYPPWLPEPRVLLKAGGALAALVLTKKYFSGSSNPAERDLHGKVIMITGGTSGIGAVTAIEIAKRGGQVILLTRQPASDPFIVELVDDMREKAGHQMIYAEQVDLESLYSVRKFATRWIDNSPPRRLDAIVLCAATLTPGGNPREETEDGIERDWQVNFLANYHLLALLSPALKIQPFDRDVRVVIATCPSYIQSPPLRTALADIASGSATADGAAVPGAATWSPGAAYARSKLALMTFGRAFQKHLDSYKRPDGLPMNARVFFVDPGHCRTAGMTRWITRGSLWGLLAYVGLYPVSWLFLKSASGGAQSILYALMEGSLLRGPGAKLIKECRVVDFARTDIDDKAAAKELWESTDALIEATEKEQAIARAKRKKDKKRAKDEEDRAREKEEKAQEMEALAEAIKKNKAAKEAQRSKGKEREGREREGESQSRERETREKESSDREHRDKGRDHRDRDRDRDREHRDRDRRGKGKENKKGKDKDDKYTDEPRLKKRGSQESLRRKSSKESLKEKGSSSRSHRK
ncbi:retinol dehydrogenase 13 [Magnaporthiopsis poae ATCC 64411]|uniref:Retinol dehydrogenase 13 n=1 Tax=Magnaporthiopsis poae (strain ATCC 64411 / 73-15) TaxID=644358 RepID=A0A0C4DZ09_MAGP6|nr:retinol dehydrogenase 13 [Magnaporthiopsis poae ATCC 64411]